jgi:hypothetical protein
LTNPKTGVLRRLAGLSNDDLPCYRAHFIDHCRVSMPGHPCWWRWALPRQPANFRHGRPRVKRACRFVPAVPALDSGRHTNRQASNGGKPPGHSDRCHADLPSSHQRYRAVARSIPFELACTSASRLCEFAGTRTMRLPANCGGRWMRALGGSRYPCTSAKDHGARSPLAPTDPSDGRGILAHGQSRIRQRFA